MELSLYHKVGHYFWIIKGNMDISQPRNKPLDHQVGFPEPAQFFNFDCFCLINYFRVLLHFACVFFNVSFYLPLILFSLFASFYFFSSLSSFSLYTFSSSSLLIPSSYSISLSFSFPFSFILFWFPFILFLILALFILPPHTHLYSFFYFYSHYLPSLFFLHLLSLLFYSLSPLSILHLFLFPLLSLSYFISHFSSHSLLYSPFFLSIYLLFFPIIASFIFQIYLFLNWFLVHWFYSVQCFYAIRKCLSAIDQYSNPTQHNALWIFKTRNLFRIYK